MHEYNHSLIIGHERNNASSQWDQSYLDQGAVAIPRCLCIKVIMVEDADEAANHRFQHSTMLLNLFHTCDQSLGNTAIWRIRGCTHYRNVVFTHCV